MGYVGKINLPSTLATIKSLSEKLGKAFGVMRRKQIQFLFLDTASCCVHYQGIFKSAVDIKIQNKHLENIVERDGTSKQHRNTSS
jgi:hypothetical protein